MKNQRNAITHVNSSKFNDGLLRAFYMLEKASNITRFSTWFKGWNKNVNMEIILPGYVFLIVSIIRVFMFDLNSNNGFCLSEDEIYRRAVFNGVKLNELPNSCEKTIFMKRIRMFEKNIARQKTWEALESSVNGMIQDLHYFKELIQKSIPLNKQLDKERLLKAMAANHTAIFLCDTSRKVPHSENAAPFDHVIRSEQYLENTFPGYVYGLEFLWFSILGEVEFSNSFISNIHNVLSNDFEAIPRKTVFDDDLSIASLIKDPFSEAKNNDYLGSEVKITGSLPEENKKKTTTHTSNKWLSLDTYFRKIIDEIVLPMEATLNISLGIDDKLILKEYKKKNLHPLLDKSAVGEPSYLCSNNRQSIKKFLDLNFLWYGLNVLEGDSLFNGVPVFGAILLGSSNFAKSINNTEGMDVIIIKHPQGGGENNYSFAVLISVMGIISDASGWVVAFNCATDYSGNGRSNFEYAMQFIKLSKDYVKVRIKEISVNEDIFFKYIQEHSVSSVFQTIVSKRDTGLDRRVNIMDLFSSIKGRLFELVVYKWVNETKELGICRSNVMIGNEEIDCIVQEKDVVNMYECKINSSEFSLKTNIKQILRKRGELLKTYENVKPFLVVYNKIPTCMIKKYNLKGIEVIDNFRDVISNEMIFKNSRTEYVKVLDLAL